MSSRATLLCPTRSAPRPTSAAVERLADGRLNIVTLGLHRFRVRQLRFDMPFLQGEVEAFPLEGAPVSQDAHSVRRLLQGYVQLLSKVLDSEIDLDEMPEDPHTLAYLTASALQIPWDEKQSLLETSDLPELLSIERALLSKETMILGFMHGSESRVRGAGARTDGLPLSQLSIWTPEHLSMPMP